MSFSISHFPFNLSKTKYLNLHKINNLKSTFIDTTNPNKSDIIVECICRHPKMDLFEFKGCLHYNTVLCHRVALDM